MGNTVSGAAADTTKAVTTAVRSSTAPDPDIELVTTTVAQLDPVIDTGAKKRVQQGLADFRAMYLATFVQDSRVSVFELYDCMTSVARAFFQLDYDCDWTPQDAATITHVRNLALGRMQACTDEAIDRTGMVDPRPTVSDPINYEQYMQLTRAWPPRRLEPSARS